MNDELIINDGIGSDILTTTPYNGEEYRRAYETKPWPSDSEIYGFSSDSDSDTLPPTPQPQPECLTFTARENNSTVKITFDAGYSGGGNVEEIISPEDYEINLEYSLDGGSTWIPYNIPYDELSWTYEYIYYTNTIEGEAIILENVGDSVKLRGRNDFFTKNDNDGEFSARHKFVISGSLDASGDITSLLNNEGGDVDLIYNEVFQGAFENGKALVSAPNLPSTTLSESCYMNTFNGCTSLEIAPELPATILSPGCYTQMFGDCTNLNYIKCLATDISANNCTNNWVGGVQTNDGLFIKASGVDWGERGASGIPTNWTIEEV